MDDRQKTLLLLAIICAAAFFLTRAHAQTVPPGEQPEPAVVASPSPAAPARRADANRLIRSAVHRLEEAALQRDFASNSQELALLQTAHDELASAVGKLCCRERERAAALEADLDHVLTRDSTYLGPLVTPAGDRFGPPAPSRDQLAQLVQEGQQLLRDAPAIHRLIDSDEFDLTSRLVPTPPRRINEYPIGLMNTDPLHMPVDSQAATTQFHFRF